MQNYSTSEMKLPTWTRFKYELLQSEEEWKTKVFDWKVDTKKINPKHPYIHINVIWSALEDKPSRYFQVAMAFENIWMEENPLVNIWKCIQNSKTHE